MKFGFRSLKISVSIFRDFLAICACRQEIIIDKNATTAPITEIASALILIVISIIHPLKKPHGNPVRLALQAKGLPLSNYTLFRPLFQSEHMQCTRTCNLLIRTQVVKILFAPKEVLFYSEISTHLPLILPVWVRLWVKCENGGKMNLPPCYHFRSLPHIFRKLMRSTQKRNLNF